MASQIEFKIPLKSNRKRKLIDLADRKTGVSERQYDGRKIQSKPKLAFETGGTK